jgi:hypothetical protein
MSGDVRVFLPALLYFISFCLIFVKVNNRHNCNYIPVATHVNALVQNKNVKKFSLVQMVERFFLIS